MARWSKDMSPEERQKRVDHAKANMADPVIHEKMFGEAAKEKRRQTMAKKKAFKNLAKSMLETGLPDGEIKQALIEAGFDQTDYQAGVLLAQLRKALIGDTEAAKFVRDSSGQKPTETMQVGTMDDIPISEMDLSQLSTAELREKIAELEEKVYEDEA